jgi:hypothetical protein
MTPEEPSMAAMFAELLMTMQDSHRAAYDAADGIRADLTSRGYAEANAERVATAWLLEAMTGLASYYRRAGA